MFSARYAVTVTQVTLGHARRNNDGVGVGLPTGAAQTSMMLRHAYGMHMHGDDDVQTTAQGISVVMQPLEIGELEKGCVPSCTAHASNHRDDHVVDPERVLSRTPPLTGTYIATAEATTTRMRGRADVTVVTFQPKSILPTLRYLGKSYSCWRKVHRLVCWLVKVYRKTMMHPYVGGLFYIRVPRQALHHSFSDILH